MERKFIEIVHEEILKKFQTIRELGDHDLEATRRMITEWGEGKERKGIYIIYYESGFRVDVSLARGSVIIRTAPNSEEILHITQSRQGTWAQGMPMQHLLVIKALPKIVELLSQGLADGAIEDIRRYSSQAKEV